MNDNNLTSNTFENLQAIKGELVKGVIEIPVESGAEWLIVFKSGYSLQIHERTCAFWINTEKQTSEILDKELVRRQELTEYVKEVRELLEKK